MPERTSPELVVAVGLSAGALEALQDLLSRVDEKAGVAYVVVRHVDPSGSELLPGLLQSRCALPVVEIAERMPLDGNRVYVAPAQSAVRIERNRFRLGSFEDAEDRRTPIDHLFHSLAEALGSRAVGVVLSGNGTDGTMGIKAIRDAGGMVIVQSPESAPYDSMPRSAVAGGMVDIVLDPPAIAGEISRYVAHLRSLFAKDHAEQISEAIGEAIPDITAVVEAKTGVDFRHYRIATLTRRIFRRMQVLRLPTVEKYLERLRGLGDEADVLFRELLIGVTSFFRDPEAFSAVGRLAIGPLVESRDPDVPVRIWVPGCATGEEAYSLAMLVVEQCEQGKLATSAQIFATDLDRRALAIARKGIYPAGVADDLGPERLRRFFTRRGKNYAVKEELRDLVTFSPHNVISDPPFSRMDLISCRNLLIYLGPHLQKKLIPLFHFALRPGGYLFLGPAENITGHPDLFRPIDTRHRIAQRQPTAIAPRPVVRVSSAIGRFRELEIPNGQRPDLQQIMQRIVLDEFAPRSVVVNDSGQILCASGSMEQYLDVGAGLFQNSVVKLVRSGLRAALRNELKEARETRRTRVQEGLTVRRGESVRRVKITVQPMPENGEGAHLYLVVFQDQGPLHSAAEVDGERSQHTAEAVEQLERELEQTWQHLESVVQELETANEELRASNEELLSANEELQSANEELKASKDEVVAAHDALGRAHSDLANLFRSTDVAVIFLDPQMRIRSFTPAAARIYNLIDTDLGRPLAHQTHRVLEMPPLPELRAVESEQPPADEEIQTDDGRWYTRRVLPYRLVGGRLDGVVLTFTDVTAIKAAELAVRESEFFLRRTLDTLFVFAGVCTPDGVLIEANRAALDAAGLKPDDVLGKPFEETYWWAYDAAVQQRLREAIERAAAGEPSRYDVPVRLGEDRLITIDFQLMPMRDGRGTITHLVPSGTDISERKRAENALAESEARFRALADNIDQLAWMAEPGGWITWYNHRWYEYTGTNLEEMQGWGWEKVHHPKMIKGVTERWRDHLEREVPWEDTFLLRGADGTYRWFLSRAEPLRDQSGKVVRWFGTNTDVTEQRRIEQALRESNERLRLALEGGRMSDWEMDASNGAVVLDATVSVLFGLERGEIVSDEQFWEHVHAEDRDRLRRLMKRSARKGGELATEFRMRRADGALRWIAANASLIRDSSGAPVRLVGLMWDVTDSREAQERLTLRARQQAAVAALGQTALSGQNLQTLFEDAVTVVAEVLGVKYCKLLKLLPGGEELFLAAGVGWKDGLVGAANVPATGNSQAAFTLSANEPVIVEDLRTETRFSGPTLLIDHEVVSGMSCIISGSDGDPWGVIGVHDIHPRKFTKDDINFLWSVANVTAAAIQRLGAEAKVRRLADIVENSSDAIIGKTMEGIITSWNRGAELMYGYTAAEAVGQHIHLIIPPARRPEIVPIFEQLRRGERPSTLETVRVCRDGNLVDVMVSFSPVTNAAGELIGISAIGRNITDRKRDEQRLRLLMSELNHRVKNTLASIDAMAHQSMRYAGSLEEFNKSFSERVRSLSQAHTLLTKTQWEGADLAEVIELELKPRCGLDGQMQVDGPQVFLLPKASLALHMVFHELCTNAAKYGALSDQNGRVSVRWDVVQHSEPKSLCLTWEESGGPPVKPPARKGFGSRVIDTTIGYELDGEIKLEFRQSGLLCTVQFPLTETVGYLGKEEERVGG